MSMDNRRNSQVLATSGMRSIDGAQPMLDKIQLNQRELDNPPRTLAYDNLK